ncbi:hypothetical protein [Idiomarina abyssalis]|uniref:hypothetical protein n=1 Tax=Idiomarina abyssalis TaxID=86102 RepID=UPI003A944CA9
MLEVIGIVGSVASIIALALPASSKSQRIIHALYVLLIVGISSAAVSYKSELDRINSAERAAKALIEDRRMNFTDEGFNMAALSFLEKYKDLYPDSYQRASKLCENNGCLNNQHAEEANSLNHAYSQINVSSALEGMLKGIGEISAD